jgi:demethylspheroidene O-methyltransferase
MVSFAGIEHLMDVGGGTGAFLRAVGTRHPDIRRTLFDLEHVVAGASDDLHVCGGSFRDDPLPQGADAVSLIRVLYDHSDDTVRALLAKIYDVLPAGGQLIISEPMGGGVVPDRATDVYFAFYTMAMQTGRTRSAAEISTLCAEAGFQKIHSSKARRSYVTQSLVAHK